jgi:hypothetical protein
MSRITVVPVKAKNTPGWIVHTLPCTTFMQLEMPDELTAILLQAQTAIATPDQS